MIKNKRKIIIKIVIICLIVLLLGGIGLYFGMLHYLHQSMNYIEAENTAPENMISEELHVSDTEEDYEKENSETEKKAEVHNILLLANDSRKNDSAGRSDAMILITINSDQKKIYMTSFLRDMYVEIPGHGSNRLNAAYAYGGVELLEQTLEKNFGIFVDDYALVNFQAFANLVDEIGGVELEITKEEVKYINHYLEEYNILEKRPEGTDYLDSSFQGQICLNGPQALAYSRIRYIGTDFARTERQRKILSSIIEKAPKALLTNAKGLLDGVLPWVTTDLSKSELSNLIIQAPLLLAHDIESGSIPLENTYENANINGMAVLEVDLEANKEYIQKEIFGK